jgi:hypothetical protein
MRWIPDWMIGFINTLYIHTTQDYRQYSAITDLHTLQFTVTHALGFSAYTSRILAVEIQQSHCHFKSHMKSSFDSLIPFLPLFCSCQFRRLDSIQFLCSQAHIPAGWHPRTRLFISDYCSLLGHVFWLCPFITPRHGPHKRQPVLLTRHVYWFVT